MLEVTTGAEGPSRMAHHASSIDRPAPYAAALCWWRYHHSKAHTIRRSTCGYD